MRNNIKLQVFIVLIITVFIASCSQDGDGNYNDGGYNSGVGGSMARFTISGDRMYTVDHRTLKMFDISTPENPRYMSSKDQDLNIGIETIFTKDTLLFIGSQTGMIIYNIKQPDFPQYLSEVQHIRSCDPVVAQGNYAYVTLNSASVWCGRNSNVLQIYDVSNPRLPLMIRELQGFKSPKGLGIDGNKLFVCDSDRGVKIFDVSDPNNPQWIDDFDHIPEARNIQAYDVIPLNELLLMIGSDGLYQFDYSGDKLAFLSKIQVNRQ